jgi:hypothetical protein
LGIALLACCSVQAKPKFSASEISGAGHQLLICDMDGDGLKDLALMDGFNLSIFYQVPGRGFTRETLRTYPLERRPCVVWTARLGGPAGSLLVMTSDGVTELCFTNRTGPPTIRQIIRQPTVVPVAAEETNALCLSLSVETGGAWPLLLVPAADGLQVWEHREEWRQAQLIGQAIEARMWPSVANPGYSRVVEFDLSVGDVNGDGRDDLMVRRSQVSGTNTYSLYLQQTNGLFAPEPALSYGDKVTPFAWLYWADLNRDGKVDLIKSIWLNEPSFVPGVPAGKVLVSVYMADEYGRIPAQPQQVFRKGDWRSVLPVLDVDGDGFQDLVLGYGHMDSREGIRKQITAKQLDYTLRFFFYRPGAGYPKESDCQRDVVIHLDHLGSPLDWSLPENFQRCVKVGGDFNGDGKADLLVRDQRGAISVYFFISREKGFSLMPDLLFNCLEPIEDWQVADLNGDGVSDLIIKLAEQDAYRIFISRK